MMKFRAFVLVVFGLSVASSARADDSEDKAVAFVQKMGGGVERDTKAPGKPVVVVNLRFSPVTDAGLKELAPFKSLTALHLLKTSITDEGVKDLAAFKNLATLNLVGCEKVTDASLKEVTKLKNLTNLALAGTGVTGAGLKELAAVKGLTTLHLTGPQVIGAGTKGLSALPNLTTLYLGGETPIPVAAVTEIASLKNLTFLDLGPSKLSDETLKALQRVKRLHVLSQAQTASGKRPAKDEDIATLNLGNQPVTNAGLRSLTTLNGLVTLYLSGTKVTSAGVKDLQMALPKCKIFE